MKYERIAFDLNTHRNHLGRQLTKSSVCSGKQQEQSRTHSQQQFITTGWATKVVLAVEPHSMTNQTSLSADNNTYKCYVTMVKASVIHEKIKIETHASSYENTSKKQRERQHRTTVRMCEVENPFTLCVKYFRQRQQAMALGWMLKLNSILFRIIRVNDLMPNDFCHIFNAPSAMLVQRFDRHISNLGFPDCFLSPTLVVERVKKSSNKNHWALSRLHVL